MQPALRSPISDASLAVFAVNGGKPHQGLAGRNPAPNQVREACKSTVQLGLRGQAELNRIGSRCTGKERDAESGNDYFGARYYASSMGRWMSPDPILAAILSDRTSTQFQSFIQQPQNWNLYAYVLNNPLIYTDPSGMECVWDDGSYDASDDKVTGSAKGCSGQGGHWVDPAMFESVEGNQAGSWSDQKNSQVQFDWLTPSATVSGSVSSLPQNGTFGPNDMGNMTKDQFISELQAQGFKVDEFEMAFNFFHPMSICNVHVTIDPHSGTWGAPVTGEWHYDLFNPFVDSGPVQGGNVVTHTAADLIPDEARNLHMTNQTGGDACTGH
jgi:RHS repeat-associated protein